MPPRPRTPNPRLRAALKRQAETVVQAAALIRDEVELDPSSRRALSDLLQHMAGDAREMLGTYELERVLRLARAIVDPHLPPLSPAKPLPPGFTSGVSAPGDGPPFASDLSSAPKHADEPG